MDTVEYFVPFIAVLIMAAIAGITLQITTNVILKIMERFE